MLFLSFAKNLKVPCSRDEPGYSHGICDGFGTCQCAPPFLGDDCSVKDCLHDCSYNGYCSVEYPVSRCVCNPSYFGEFCEQIECLNNCSYVNRYTFDFFVAIFLSIDFHMCVPSYIDVTIS